MKTTSCDAVALTTDLYACIIEVKVDRPRQRDLQQLVLGLAASNPIGVSDEQILALP